MKRNLDLIVNVVGVGAGGRDGGAVHGRPQRRGAAGQPGRDHLPAYRVPQHRSLAHCYYLVFNFFGLNKVL